MIRTFYKYHGTGNDFILFDDRENTFPEKDTELIARLCHRRFGIGADGLLLVRNEPGYDFRMIYVNSDGKPSSMCGNGARCISRFAKDIGVVTKEHIRFVAVDGVHEALIKKESVQVKMGDVGNIEPIDGSYFLNTGSPHFVSFRDGVNAIDVYNEGKAIRYSTRFAREGTNVNFVEKKDNGIYVRTYERGVEDETLSCGTGVTASALAAALCGLSSTEEKCFVQTPGGNLIVHFRKSSDGFREIWLEGPATFVFKGEIGI